jgi:hypothetical protein
MSAPVFEAVSPVRGSLRLVVLRWALSVLAGLPAIMATKGALSAAASQPWFTEAPDPLPLPQFFGVMGHVGGVMPIVILGAVIVWLFNQLLTAAAIETLDPGRGPGRVRLWRTMVDTGWRYFLIYLRVSVFAALFLFIGARILSVVFESLAERGDVEGWTGKTLVMTLPLLRALLLLAWAGVVGVGAWWSRLILLRDGRRYVRRMLGILPRVLWRSPVQGFLFHWVLGAASVVAGAAVLVAWRQTPGVATAWFAVWLLLLLAQALVWHWRLRTMSLIWSRPSFDDLRERPDAPWGVFRWMWSKLPRRRAVAATASEPTAESGPA